MMALMFSLIIILFIMMYILPYWIGLHNKQEEEKQKMINKVEDN